MDRIISGQFKHLARNSSAKADARALELSTNIHKQFKNGVDIDEKTQKTESLLRLTSDFFKSDSNKPHFNGLLQAFQQSPILGDYLDLADMGQNKMDLKYAAQKIAELEPSVDILSEQPSQGLISYPSSSTSKMKEQLNTLKEEAIGKLQTYHDKREANPDDYYTIWARMFSSTESRSRTAKLKAAKEIIESIKDGSFDKDKLAEATKNGELEDIIKTFKF